MSKFIDSFIKKNKPQFTKYNRYIKQNDWSTEIDVAYDEEKEVEELTQQQLQTKEILKILEDKVKLKRGFLKQKEDEFKVQDTLVVGILNRLKYFVKKTESDHHLKKFKQFIKYSLNIIDIHTNRVDSYINDVDISTIKNTDLKRAEIEFHNELFKAISKIQDVISELNISEDAEETSGIEFLGGVKAPLSMHKILVKLYPEIDRKLKAMKIDFDSPPDNEMHIYNEDAPTWNVDKHYFDQDPKTLQYYVDEFKKLENGISIDGVYFSGWAYYHMNVYITNIPHKVWNDVKKDYDSKDIEINPPLRDSDWMIFENRERQEKMKILFMFIAATRRAAKTTAESSMLAHAATIGKPELLCAGASAKDLGQVAKNFKTDILHKNPAFAVYNVTNDWDKKVEMGIKRKDGKTIPLSTLHIINTDSGNNKEIFAGFTPDVMVLDEAMKEKFLEALEGLLPALRGEDGMVRCFGLLSGTGGTDALSSDGLKCLTDPETYDILPMQWDILERGIPLEHITWEEDKLKPFGTFIPGQCRVDMPKIDSTLADYLGKPESEKLRKIKIKVTNWELAKEQVDKRREKVSKDKIKLQKETVYCPLKPSEIFMSGARNRFPVAEAKAHKAYLLETGLWDRRRNLYRDSTGKIQVEISNKELAEFPHRGGIVDAPFLIFEDPPKEKPKYGTYTGGFDDYASEESDTSSLSSFYVMKNEILGDPFSNKIVASITFRPGKHREVHEKWLMLMELYNLDQTAFGENFNYAIKEHLERTHVADKYLAPSLDFSASFNIPNSGRRKTGWNPTTSKKFLFNLFVDYCNEDFELEKEDGTIVLIKGVQRIDDIGLLEEIIQYSENLNVDRITSAMGANGYRFYLISSHRWKPSAYRRDRVEDKPKPPKKRERSFYTPPKKRAGFYKRRG